MNSSAWVDPRLEMVTVSGLCSYLLARGWRQRTYPGPELLVFEGPADDDGRPIVQVLPSSERMLDFRMRAEELIAALGALEERPARDVLEEVLAAGAGEHLTPPPVPNGASEAPNPAAPAR